MASIPRVFQLSGTCNNYPWGKKGRDSLTARLCENNDTQFVIKDDEHYSEMWFGDYPDFPGRVLETGELLSDVLKRNKETLLGANASGELGTQLPFLPKILSIDKALPLQIHPNKKLAADLHRQDPDKFTDPNHKPEIAIALSKFEVFVGWKPLSAISPLFNVPSLRRFIPPGTTQWNDDTLREVTRGLLLADEETVRAIENDLIKLSRNDLDELDHQSYIGDLLPRLQKQYSATDPGTLVALLCMNYFVLEAGEALFIPADGIHAYLSGDIVECMARSNNVLNSGFCPRADRDNIDLFVKTLTFGAGTKGDDSRLPALKADDGCKGRTVAYRPPTSEFDALGIDLGPGEDEEIRAQRGPGVAIATRGGGTLVGDGREFAVKEGSIFFIAPGTSVVWRAGSNLQVYVAIA